MCDVVYKRAPLCRRCPVVKSGKSEISNGRRQSGIGSTFNIMAARNRPRNGLAKDDGADAHEERTMWNSIVNDLRKLKTLQTRAAEVSKQQVDLEAKISKGRLAF